MFEFTVSCLVMSRALLLDVDHIIEKHSVHKTTNKDLRLNMFDLIVILIREQESLKTAWIEFYDHRTK